MRQSVLSVFSCGVWLAACSGGSDAPPTTPAPKPVASVTVTADRTRLLETESITLQAVARDAAGTTLTDRPITWSSSDNTVASVTSGGVVTAVRAGTVGVSGSAEGKSGTVSLTVVPIPAAAVAVTAQRTTIFTFDTVRVTAVVNDSLGRPLSGRAVTWSVSDVTRAGVSPTGVFTSNAPGAVTVIATAEGKTGTATISIVPRRVATVSINAPVNVVQVDSSTQLIATSRDSSGFILSVLQGPPVTWQLSDSTLARVSSAGRLTGVLPGTLVVRAVVDGIGGTAPFTVRAPTLEREYHGISGHFTGVVSDNYPERATWGWGYSFYSTIAPVKPNRDDWTQLGWGNFMQANNVEDENNVEHFRPPGVCPPQAPPFDLFQSNEGGVGSWGDMRFPTVLPKYSIGATADCYISFNGGPGYAPGGIPLASNAIYFAQISNRLLISADRLNFVNPSGPTLFGYGWIALPLISANKSPFNIPTGSNSWTLFMNTTNFKGPVGFFTPAFWTSPDAIGGTSAGYGLDRRAAIYSLLTLEIGFTPNFSATDGGTEYRRIPRMTFSADASRRAGLLQDYTVYSKDAVWNGVSTWLNASGSPLTQFNAVGRRVMQMTTDPGGVSMLDGGQPIDFNGMVSTVAFPVAGGGNAWGLQWGAQAEAGVIPEYYKKVNGRWTAIPASQVPRRTWLSDQAFPQLPRGTVTPLNTTASSPWTQSKWAAGPFTASLGDGSTVQFVWYRFVDQPAIARLNLSDAERTRLQAWAESVHSQGLFGFTIAAPGAGTLTTIDPGHIVTPPAGLSVGYVPIAIGQN
jgi:uncharacterized protein YjdB